MTGNTLRPNTGKRTQILHRRKVVAANLLAGLTQKDIAAALNVSKATVSGDVKAVVEEWRQQYTESMASYVHLQMKRLDVLLTAVWEDARGGRDNSLDRALHIIDRQNVLMKVDKGQPLISSQPVQINIVGVPHREKMPEIN